jgi:hypothetical protein
VFSLTSKKQNTKNVPSITKNDERPFQLFFPLFFSRHGNVENHIIVPRSHRDERKFGAKVPDTIPDAIDPPSYLTEVEKGKKRLEIRDVAHNLHGKRSQPVKKKTYQEKREMQMQKQRKR